MLGANLGLLLYGEVSVMVAPSFGGCPLVTGFYQHNITANGSPIPNGRSGLFLDFLHFHFRNCAFYAYFSNSPSKLPVLKTPQCKFYSP